MLNKINRIACEIDTLIRLNRKIGESWDESNGDATYLQALTCDLIQKKNLEIISITTRADL